MKSIFTSTLLLILNLGIAQTTITIDNLSKFKEFSTEQVDLTKGEKLLGVFNTNCDHSKNNPNLHKVHQIFL